MFWPTDYSWDTYMHDYEHIDLYLCEESLPLVWIQHALKNAQIFGKKEEDWEACIIYIHNVCFCTLTYDFFCVDFISSKQDLRNILGFFDWSKYSCPCIEKGIFYKITKLEHHWLGLALVTLVTSPETVIGKS